MIPETTRRVEENTSGDINERIRRETELRVARCAALGKDAIGRRIDELDHEWDIERAIEANAGTVSLAGIALGTLVHRRFFALPAIVAGFLLQHAIQGWCPPVPILRRWGFRTQSEIEHERYALKTLRGDFRGVEEAGGPDSKLAADVALEAARP
jgi:hypothetical protein